MMNKVLLGSTGIYVSRIGLGTVKFGRNLGVKYPKAFELPSDQEIKALLECAQHCGINLLDTAPAYGRSEERLGKMLKDNRHEWVLCTKVGEEFAEGESHFNFSPQAIHHSIRRSLKRLHTDFLDIVLVHSNGDDKKIIEEDGVFNTLADIKKAGLIRSFGMSSKTLAGGLLTVDHADVVMVAYHPEQSDEKGVIEYAYQKHKGVFIKKALASGHFRYQDDADPVFSIMRFILKEPGVSSIIIGTLNASHLQHDVSCALQALS